MLTSKKVSESVRWCCLSVSRKFVIDPGSYQDHIETHLKNAVTNIVYTLSLTDYLSLSLQEYWVDLRHSVSSLVVGF